MRRLSVLVHLISAMLVSSVAHGQSKICPNNDPAKRPANITPATYNLSKVVNFLRSPQLGLVLLISHRGDWEFCPENTLESFQSAWDLGAEGAEMDVRISSPGTDPVSGNYFPSGEVFLSHDYDLRGEAPMPPGSSQTSNYIYSLDPSDLESRNMADRHGKILKDSLQNYLHMASFTQLLQSVRARATNMNLIQQGASPRISGWDYMARGMLLVVDVKGYVSKNGNGVGQYDTFMEAVKEMYSFEAANHLDLGDAIAFKVQYKDFATRTAGNLLADVTDQSNGYQPGLQVPRIIFIVFPQDACVVPANDAGTPCQPILPVNNIALNNFRDHYLNPSNSTNGLLAIDWQYRNEGDVLAAYVTDPGWSSWGRSMFLASNNFAEGVRNSGGDCKNTFTDSKAIPQPAVTQPPINSSFCTSDPIQRWSSASLDYLVPSFGPSHATSVTTDLFLNASNYLTAIGLNNTSLIQ